MNELTDALALIPGGDPEAIRQKVADYQAALSRGAAEPKINVGGGTWEGDRLAFAIKLFADLKSEIGAGADNDELRDYAESYAFRTDHLFDVLRLLV